MRNVFKKNRVLLLVGVITLLLVGISVFSSYAFYQVKDAKAIITGRIARIPDLEVRVMLQTKNSDGTIGTGYALSSYIPKFGYSFNSTKSYCVNGSQITYENTEAVVLASNTDLCYLYMDATSTEVADIVMNIYAENIDSNGNGLGTYSMVGGSKLTNGEYWYNSSKGGCTNGSSVSYDDTTHTFLVDATKRDVCNVYMDKK